MRIAWFTPFHPYSSIGRDGRLVCEELQKQHQVTIYSCDQGERIKTSLPVIHYKASDFDVRSLKSYDFTVYNMGNYALNHKDIWEVMQRYPGITIIHDQIMQNFFSQITLFPEYGGDPKTGEQVYLRMMRKYYGKRGEAAGASQYKAYFSDDRVRIWSSEAASAYPLIEPLLDKSVAVFTHASFFEKRIQDHFYGPTGYAYLPYLPEETQPGAKIPAEFVDGSKTLVVSSGIVHPVKRIERVAEMLLRNPDIAQRVRYAVIGEAGGPYGDYLTELSQGPLKGCLYLLGYQSNEVMSAFLQEADFCINIRYPNSEVCSKSLIEQMAFKNPVIVLNSGIFAEFPDNCVEKIKLENEIPELANAFRSLIDDKERRMEIGLRAAQFVEMNCSPEGYASRFVSFLEKIPGMRETTRVINDSIKLNRTALVDLSFNQESAPWIINSISRQLNTIFGAISPENTGQKVLGVWFGFPYKTNLRREGITRFLLYMLLAMLEQYPIESEIWTYSINEEEIRLSFEQILSDPALKSRVRIVTENNYGRVLQIPSYKLDLPFEVNENLDNLAEVARQYSRADRFITAIVYLDNVVGTGKPIFVPVHDLSLHVHYDDFITANPHYKAYHVDIRSRAENLARSGAVMFSNSEYVRREQLLKNVYCINEENTRVIYLPVNVPRGINDQLLSEPEIRGKYHLVNPYIFYPTQVRPYKNVSILVEALAILRERVINLDLVLTGDPSDVPGVKHAIAKHNIQDRVICLSSVNEQELYSLYRYAAAAGVPTLFEGGFPWQACEALFMDTPLVLSNIPVVQERIQFCGFSKDDCGLELFDPFDPLECADAIERVLRDRSAAVASQQLFKEKFLSYSWKDAAAKYYSLFYAG